jgi:hypothetical protein
MLNPLEHTHYILDEDHNVVPAVSDFAPFDLEGWTRWMEFFFDIENRRVGLDTVAGIEVSTVFIGMAGTLFETLITANNEQHLTDRYQTWQEARHGHRLAVRKLQLRYGED